MNAATLGDGLVLRRATPADADALATFVADVLRTAFERGRLATAQAWTPSIDTAGVEFALGSGDVRRPSAMFPGLTFLQLLFGSRSLDELEHAFADCIVRTVEARSLLNALFPKAPSCVNPVV